jgi:serine/threonine-protein kinase RsbW
MQCLQAFSDVAGCGDLYEATELKSRCVYKNNIPSIKGEIGIVAADLISSLRESYGEIDEETVFDLKVIINEVLINAIMHGNNEDAAKSVKIDASLTEDDSLFLIIEDEGLGYDYSEICRGHESYVTDPFEMIESGRGMKIVQGLCEKVKVNKKGNKVMIVKRIGRH